MLISSGCVVSLSYRLTNMQGRVLAPSVAKASLVYLHGAGKIVPGLESALAGKQAGDSFAIDVPCLQAYGPRHEQLVQEFPISALAEVENPQVGSVLSVKTRSGAVQHLHVTAITDTHCCIDANHPLAGLDLHFAGVIKSVRRATEQEIADGCARLPDTSTTAAPR